MQNDETRLTNYTIAYLSGAPRVSTRPEAEAAGPRSHVVGVMEAFNDLGWEVIPFIVGDQVPLEWIQSSSQKTLRKSFFTRTASDLVRIVFSYKNRLAAVQSTGTTVDWVYERLGAFQSLGRAYQKWGVPWILESNAPLFFEAKSDRQSMTLGGIARKIEINAYKRCDVLVCITEVLKEIIVEEAKIPPEKIVVMPNGVNTIRFDPQKVKPERFFNFPTIVFVGNLRPWQGLSLLITALGEMKAKGEKMGLVIVGDGPAREESETLIAHYQLQDQVRMIGQVPWDDVPRYIAGADLGYSGRMAPEYGKVYFSPLKLYEYLAMGKPVVAAAHQDAREVIVPDETGYLFEPENVEDLLKSLKHALINQSRWSVMGEIARQKIVENHSWKSRVNALIPQAENIIKRKYGRSYPEN